MNVIVSTIRKLCGALVRFLIHVSLLAVGIILGLLVLLSPFLIEIGLAWLPMSYQRDVANEFARNLHQQVVAEKRDISLHDLVPIAWDRVCFLYEIDDSFSVEQMPSYIKRKKLQFGHWTQRVPSLLALFQKEGEMGLLPSFTNSYSLALLFIDGNKVVRVVEPGYAQAPYDVFSYRSSLLGGTSKIYDGECLQDATLSVAKKQKAYSIYSVLWKPVGDPIR
ncbi:hypothetical protein [Micavibrio aeruginosavorus]|uniref:hypothetical protein n=1 Tax=Micavibrio aeruginosavorus TaxID=349221 RepID=UPI003F4A9179